QENRWNAIVGTVVSLACQCRGCARRTKDISDHVHPDVCVGEFHGSDIAGLDGRLVIPNDWTCKLARGVVSEEREVAGVSVPCNAHVGRDVAFDNSMCGNEQWVSIGCSCHVPGVAHALSA